jgi:hypothetical protein
MNVEKSYEKFLIKANENFETSKIAVDRGRFVIIYNEAANKLIENILDRKQDDEYRYIQKLLVKDQEINRENTLQQTDYFALPKNYFDYTSAYTKATKGKCKARIDLYEVKDDNLTEILNDSNQKPSFLAREAPFIFSNDSIGVLKDDFLNEKLYLSYYRYPTQIRLEDPNNPESNFDENFPIEFDDKLIDRIITNTVAEVMINYQDPSFQVRKQQSITKF